MESLSHADVEQVIRVVGAAAGLDAPLPQRRRELVEGIATLIAANAWAWGSLRAGTGGRSSAIIWMDGGFDDEARRAAFTAAMADPEVLDLYPPPVAGGRPATAVSDEWLSRHPPERQDVYRRAMAAAGVGHTVASAAGIGDGVVSVLALHRHDGRPPFGPRERAIVDLVFGGIDWLHRTAGEAAAGARDAFDLTPRERQVLTYLLGGDSRKAIAAKLTLSEHTVSDHIKSIYKRCKVNSRPELLAKYMTGRM